MSLLFIVDGYNAIRRSDLFERATLQDTRTAFLNFLEIHRPHGSTRNRLIVVFDGRQDVFGERHDLSFEVIFSPGTSADEKIKELVLGSSSPKNIVVVTDDRGIVLSVRRSGAATMSTQEFLSKKKEPSQRQVFEPPKMDLNIVEREAITEELKKIWLKRKSS